MYKAILFSPDGDWVTDYYGCKTKEEVLDLIDNQGSKWIFYPLYFVIVDHSDKDKLHKIGKYRIVGAPPLWNDCIGKTIKSIERYLENLTDFEREELFF